MHRSAAHTGPVTENSVTNKQRISHERLMIGTNHRRNCAGGSVPVLAPAPSPSVPLCLCGEYQLPSQQKASTLARGALVASRLGRIHHRDTEALRGTEKTGFLEDH